MRLATKSSVQYSPGPVPADPSQIQSYLQDEFQNLRAAILLLSLGHLDPETVAPDKPRDGDIRIADGAPNWNPGSGRGVYWYDGKAGAWKILG